MAQYVFKRKEQKYLVSREKLDIFKDMIAPYIKADEYGQYTICNIYYDTETYDLIRHSLDKPVYKEKLRLRSYGIPADRNAKVFVELKKKYKGVVYKRRVSMLLSEAESFLNNGKIPVKYGQIASEIAYFRDFYHPVPKVYLAYDRTACCSIDDPDLRITFDHNIRSRTVDLSFQKGDFGDMLLADDEYLMEIKIPDAMPLWLTHALSELTIYPASFSKYGKVYESSFEQIWGDIKLKPACMAHSAENTGEVLQTKFSGKKALKAYNNGE